MSITNEKLQTIKDNVSKVYRSGQMDVIKNANSLKGFESGKAILLDDISPVEHEMKVKVRGKNLFDVNTTPTFTYTKATYVVEGTKVTFKSNNIANNNFFYSIPTTVGKTYTVSVNSIDWDSTSYGIFLSSDKIDDKNNYGNISKTILTRTFVAVSDTLWIHGYLSYEAGDFTFTFDKLQVELGTTATDYTPYIPDLTAVKVKKQGKNLIPFPYRDLKLGTSTYNGIDFTVYEDGSILINGTATSNTTRYLYNNATDLLGLKPGITISCSKNTSDDTQQGNIYLVCNYYDSTGTMQPGAYASTTSSGKKTITDNWKGLGIYLHIPKGKTLNNLLIKPQLEIGTTSTECEPYISPTEYTPNADGTVEGVTSLYPNTTLTTDTDGVIIDCDYYKDIDKAFNELSSAIALSGGE